MHGAILADAYGIPWTPVKAYPHTTEFKWRDWGGSLDLDFSFTELPAIWRGEKHLSRKRQLIQGVKRSLTEIGIQPRRWSRVYGKRKPSNEAQIDDAAKELRSVTNSTTFQVSSSSLRHSTTDFLMAKISERYTN